MASPSLFFAFLLARWVLPRFLLGWWGSLASFHWLCLVHVQIEAVWLVLGARGDVSRRVITYIGWDGIIEAVLLVCGGPSHYWDIVFVFINSFLLFFYQIFYRKNHINSGSLLFLVVISTIKYWINHEIILQLHY